MSETFEYDNLIAGNNPPPVPDAALVALGQAWSRGQLVAQKTSGEKWEVVDYEAKDSYSDFGIAVEAIDTTSGEKRTTVYVEGEFNENAVLIGESGYGDDADKWRVFLKTHSIYLRSSVNTAGY